MEKAILTVAGLYEPAMISGEPYPLINSIAAIHMAYNNMEKELFWIAEFSDNYPDLPVKLVELYSSETAVLLSSKRVVHIILNDVFNYYIIYYCYKVIHLQAVQLVLTYLSADRKSKEWSDDILKKWILDCHANKGAIESILSQVGHDEWTKAKIVELK